VQEGAVEYLGESNDVRPFVGEASVVVLPSYREGLPRTLLEGAAMGRPLIASNVPGCTQVVEDGVNGFLCEPRDAVSLADAIERVIGLDRDALIAMGLRGRALVEDRFADAQVIEQYLSALRAHALPARAADAGL
jgi:glycosyltransferase involved in cell wall biosynthesis